MSSFAQIHTSLRKFIVRIRSTESELLPLVALLVLVPVVAHVQGSPFDNALRTLFTGTVAKVASLIAIVIGGYQFGVAAGTDIAVLAVKHSDLAPGRLADQTTSERSYPYTIEQ
jgi:type IV secretory pathway VirB2 component (pilin)